MDVGGLEEDHAAAAAASSSSYVHENVAASSVPAKRKALLDDPNNAGNTPLSEAHRAYIAHAAPHLLNPESPLASGSASSNSNSNGNNSNGLSHVNRDSIIVKSARSTPDPSSLRSTPSSHRPVNGHSQRSPSTSVRVSPTPSEDERDRSTSRSLGSPLGHLQHSHPSNASPLAESSVQQRSHHSVPKKYRGPLPRLGDAEDILPLPNLVPVAGSSLFNVANYPLNRNGWRYTGAGPASHVLPQTVYRSLETEPYGVHWSWSDRSAFTHLSNDATTISASSGFRSARANVPVRQGSWYVEIHILEPEGPPSNEKGGNHVRLGWGRREAGLNAPVGCNGYSYGMRDVTGEKVFLSRTYPYGQGFKPGDVVGMWINLPPVREAKQDDPLDPARIERKRLPIRYRGKLYFEQLEYAAVKEMDHLMDRSRRGEKLITPRGHPVHEVMINPSTGMLTSKETEAANAISSKRKKGGPPPPGSASSQKGGANLRSLPSLGPDSLIGFFVNGVPQGIAFQNLLDYRPLRKQRSSNDSVKTKFNSRQGIGHDEKDDVEEKVDVITTSSTAATILKSRENHFDDGALGYFPFVSLYGNAKVRMVSRADSFRFPPPRDVRQALYEADKAQGRTDSLPYVAGMEGDGHADEAAFACRPLEDRFGEFMEELWRHDQIDEEKALVKALRQQEEESSSEEEDSRGGTANASTGKSAKKSSKKRSVPNARRTASQTPAQNGSPSSSSPAGHANDVQPVEAHAGDSHLNAIVKQEDGIEAEQGALGIRSDQMGAEAGHIAMDWQWGDGQSQDLKMPNGIASSLDDSEQQRKSHQSYDIALVKSEDDVQLSMDR